MALYELNVVLSDGAEPVVRNIVFDGANTIGQLLFWIIEEKLYPRLKWDQSPALHEPAPVGSSDKWGTRYYELTRLCDIFPNVLDPTQIHVVIATSSGTVPTHKPVPSKNEVERTELLSYLYETGQRLRFFLVQGTPGSGKTVLCQQLRNYILNTNSDARVTTTGIWFQRDSVSASLNASTTVGDIIDLEYKGVHWVLIDEAQTTYRDVYLWNTALKDLPNRFIFVLFASYGRQKRGAADIIGTPNNVQAHQRMGLRPTDNGDMLCERIPGLYFTREEYQRLVPMHQANLELPHLASDIDGWIFEATNGHIGAISSLLAAVTSTAGTRSTEMNMASFFASFSSPEQVFQRCALGSAFDRGLPNEASLEDVDNLLAVGFCTTLLREEGPRFFEHHLVTPGARRAHEQGWVTLDEVQDESGASCICTDFPSPFHRSRLSFLLLGCKTLPPAVARLSLFQFVCEVVAAFSCNALQLPQRHVSGPGSKPSIPEAQYQNEFYRAAYRITDGQGLWLSPEFGTGNSTKVGRIDFYIMGGKGWGIEMLREGDEIKNHMARFEQGGAYYPWIQTGSIKEHIVLDCRTSSQPRKPYPQYPNLYHVVFDQDSSNYKILNNKLEVVRLGVLLA